MNFHLIHRFVTALKHDKMRLYSYGNVLLRFTNEISALSPPTLFSLSLSLSKVLSVGDVFEEDGSCDVCVCVWFSFTLSSLLSIPVMFLPTAHLN